MKAQLFALLGCLWCISNAQNYQPDPNQPPPVRVGPNGEIDTSGIDAWVQQVVDRATAAASNYNGNIPITPQVRPYPGNNGALFPNGFPFNNNNNGNNGNGKASGGVDLVIGQLFDDCLL